MGSASRGPEGDPSACGPFLHVAQPTRRGVGSAGGGVIEPVLAGGRSADLKKGSIFGAFLGCGFGPFFDSFVGRLFEVRFGVHFGFDFRPILGPFPHKNVIKRGGPSKIGRNPGFGGQKGAFTKVIFRRFWVPFWGGWKSLKSTYLRWILTFSASNFDFFQAALPAPILAPIWVSFWDDFCSILGPFPYKNVIKWGVRAKSVEFIVFASIFGVRF